nr:biopolymer transporter ExbD [Sphingomonas sp.]
MVRLPAIEAANPLSEMNVTPLIDVMLVLLIMFIITIPIQTHAVKLDLPTCAACPGPLPASNEVVITRTGAILWNGVNVGEGGLRYELALTKRMRRAPELHLRPDAEARYEAVDRVLADIKRAQIEKFGFVGNEAYAF